MSNFGMFIGRTAFSLVFLYSGVLHLMQWDFFVKMAASQGLPMPELLLGVATLFLILGSLLIIIGYRACLGALMILSFLLVTMFTMHDFWNATAAARDGQLAMFWRNASLAGGCLLIMAFGPGNK